MPENQHPQLVPPALIWLNSKNDLWLEVPRYEGVVWGGMLFGAILVSLFLMVVVPFLYVVVNDSFDLLTISNAFFIIFVITSFFLLFLKTYFIAARDQPIRLNRKRQKIYSFDYKRKWWNPWGKWPTTVRAFDWADVHGEIRYCSDRYRSGYQLWGSVCEPGTYNVVHRFPLADGVTADLQQIWSFLCLYMKGEPVPAEPKNKGRPDSWRPRKADKWPDEMERESTTAPESESPSLKYNDALPDSRM